jgi:hypothetical protein
MTVYILFNDCPGEFAEPSIVAVYSKKKNARKKMNELQKKDAYEYQYLTIITIRIDDD